MYLFLLKIGTDDHKMQRLAYKSDFWSIHLKSYLCKNFGFQHIGMKRELGETPRLSPQL